MATSHEPKECLALVNLLLRVFSCFNHIIYIGLGDELIGS